MTDKTITFHRNQFVSNWNGAEQNTITTGRIQVDDCWVQRGLG
jgi:hypothetical protein